MLRPVREKYPPGREKGKLLFSEEGIVEVFLDPGRTDGLQNSGYPLPS